MAAATVHENDPNPNLIHIDPVDDVTMVQSTELSERTVRERKSIDE